MNVRLTLLLLAALAAPARAQTIAAESFAYSAGTLAGQSGGSGWGGAWMGAGGVSANRVTTPGLTDADLQAAGNKLTTSGSGAGSFRTLGAAIDGSVSQTVWLGFLVRNTFGADTSGTNYAGLSLTQTGNGEQFFIGAPSGGNVYGYKSGSADGTTGGSALTSSTPTDSGTHFLATELIFGDNPDGLGSGTTVNFYVDPTFGVTPNAADASSFDQDSVFSFDGVRFQSGDGNNTAYDFDELRLGRTFADIAPTPAPPGLATAFLGLFVAGLRARRRLKIRALID